MFTLHDVLACVRTCVHSSSSLPLHLSIYLCYGMVSRTSAQAGCTERDELGKDGGLGEGGLSRVKYSKVRRIDRYSFSQDARMFGVVCVCAVLWRSLRMEFWLCSRGRHFSQSFCLSWIQMLCMMDMHLTFDLRFFFFLSEGMIP